MNSILQKIYDFFEAIGLFIQRFTAISIIIAIIIVLVAGWLGGFFR